MGFLLIFLFLFIWSGQVLGGEIVDEIIATVNGDIITRNQLEQEVLIFKLEKGTEVDLSYLKKEILQKMIEDYLLQQEAKKEGFTVSEMEVQRVVEKLKGDISQEQFVEELEKRHLTLEDLKKRLTGQILQEKIIKWKVKQLEEEVELKEGEIEIFFYSLRDYLQGEKSPDTSIVEFYKIYRKELDEVEKVYLSRIIVEDREKAEKIMEKLSEGESIQRLLNESSGDCGIKKVEDLGWFSLNQLHSSIREAVMNLREREVIGPIEINQNHYQILEVKERKTLSIEKWENKIQNYLTRKKTIALLEKWLKELKEDSFIQILDENLKYE